jgi:two-component system LytT family response regulator
MDKVRTIIIDDEILAREVIKKYISADSSIEVVGECSNGFEGIKAISELQPDIVFLDIQMPKINGFEMLELIENHPAIIFTTAFDQYAIKAFEVNAVDYLLKPFSEERFKSAVDKAISRLNNKDDNQKKISDILNHVESSNESLTRVIVKIGSKINIIPIEKINWLEAQDDYVMIHTSDGKFLKQKTMKFFEDNLASDQFIRVHRSYIVRFSFIKRVELFEKESYKVILHDGNKIPVSKSGYSRLKEILR